MPKPFLDWDHWGSDGREWLNQAIEPRIMNQLLQQPDCDWIKFIDQNRTTGSAIARDFSQWLTAHFGGIRAIHATRLLDLSSIRHSGLRAWSPIELAQNAATQFRTFASATDISSAVRYCEPDHCGGRVYLFSCLSAALRLDSSPTGSLPSFATDGGEFHDCVRNRLGLAPNTVDHAYLLACQLPWYKIDQEVVDRISQDALLSILAIRCFPSRNFSLRTLECISTRQDIDPLDIVEYANVDALVNREDLSIADIAWQPLE